MKKLCITVLFLLTIACVPEPERQVLDDWEYIESGQAEIPGPTDDRWQEFQLEREFNNTTWFRTEVPVSDDYLFLFIPHLTLHGHVSVYFGNDLVYFTQHDPSESDYELAEAMMDIVIPHLIPLGKVKEKYINIRIEPVRDRPVSVTKNLSLVDESGYLRILLRMNADLFFVASVLIFISLIAIPAAFIFPAERKRILILTGLNVAGAITLAAGTPYVWSAFSQSYASVRWVIITKDFIPVFIFWFFCVDARKNRPLLWTMFYLHTALALISIPVILMTGMFGNDFSELNMAVFFVTQFVLVYVIFTDYFKRDKKSRLIAYGSLVMLLFSLNDILKSFGLTFIERPTYHWGLFVAALIMIYVLYLEFASRGAVIKKNLEHFKELAFITSHKLRHPIANMIGLVDMLEKESLTASEKSDWIKMLSLSSKQLDAMVHRMNELTIFEAHKKENREAAKRNVKEILLIDDDKINNLVNSRLIQFHAPHIKVTVFDRAEAALEFLNSHDSLTETMIFLDINMDGMNGFEFLEAVSHHNDKLMIYMLSSSIDENDIQKSYTYHCVYQYVIKPLRKSDFEFLVQPG